MADIKTVDLRLVLGRLRPTSGYHWRGNGSTGNDYSAIGEWRDPKTAKPTEAEILAEWDVYQVEEAARQAKIAAHAAKLQQLRPQNADDLDLSAYAGQSPLNTIARKVAWLEQEIRNLRGE